MRRSTPPRLAVPSDRPEGATPFDAFPTAGDWDGDGRDAVGILWWTVRAMELPTPAIDDPGATRTVPADASGSTLPVAGDWNGTDLVTARGPAPIYGPLPDEAKVVEGLPALNAAMTRAGIYTPARKAAFLATVRNESGFRYDAVETGNERRYRGRGLIQLTGDFNYRAAGSFLGLDLVNNPDLVLNGLVSSAATAWYWTVARNINMRRRRARHGGREHRHRLRAEHPPRHGPLRRLHRGAPLLQRRDHPRGRELRPHRGLPPAGVLGGGAGDGPPDAARPHTAGPVRPGGHGAPGPVVDPARVDGPRRRLPGPHRSRPHAGPDHPAHPGPAPTDPPTTPAPTEPPASEPDPTTPPDDTTTSSTAGDTTTTSPSTTSSSTSTSTSTTSTVVPDSTTSTTLFESQY